MKKLLSLFVPLLALFLAFAPQSAQAELDVAGNLTKPFTIETTTTSSGGKIEFRHYHDISGSAKTTVNFEYRKQVNGVWDDTWTTVSEKDVTTYKQYYDRSITLSANTTYKIQFRGVNPKGFGKNRTTDYYRIILGSSSTAWNVTMYGNIMSLIVGYDDSDVPAAQAALAAADNIPSEACFANLFNNNVQTGVGAVNTPLTTMSPPIINAENLIFPAKYLKNHCYYGLFYTSSQNYTEYCNSPCSPSGPLISSYSGGLNEGPCFLAEEFTDIDGNSVNNAFQLVFFQCSSLNSAHFSFTTCPTGDNMSSWIYTTNRNKTLYAPAAFIACTIDGQNPVIGNSANWDFNENKQWSGSVVWSNGGGGGEEPGGGGGESITPATVNVYQAGTTDTTKILYDLPANAVDLGTGVAWATTDYDASTVSKFAADTRGATGLTGTIFGSNCSCDPRTQITQNVWYAYSNITPPANWRFPTDDECLDLTQNIYSLENYGTDNYRFQINSRISDEDYIQLSCVGFLLYGSDGNWWSPNYNTSWQDINHYYIRINSTKRFGYGNDGKPTVIVDGNGESYMMPARFVYNPSFTTHTLTIQCGDKTYTYKCEHGQEVTVTAVPDEMQEFKWWSDDHSNTTATRTFTVDQDMEVKAVFKLDSSIPQHTATFRNWDGTELYQVDVAVGAMPVYAGSTPTKTDWFFNGWLPAISVMGDADVVYTATFRDFESAPANVNIYQGMTADTMKILYNLDPKDGADGKTYIPVDMGYGVAWADRNVGATSKTDVGTYFQWGNTDPNISFPTSSPNTTISSSLGNGYTLPDNQDAAYVNVGTRWHMPTNTEWTTFKDNTTLAADGGTFKNKLDETKSIFIPASGYYISDGLDKGAYRFYWSKVLYYNKQRGKIGVYVFNNYNPSTYSYIVDYYDHQNTTYTFNTNYYGMPVRAIYVPSFTTCTLTVNVGAKKYQYICQVGQEVTVTANANEGYEFDEWKLENGNTDATDTHLATRTFTITGNITRTATFKEVPTGSTVSIVADNTGYGSVDVATINNVPDNSPITVNSNTLTINNTTVTATVTESNTAQYTYTFTGWTDDKGKDLPESVTDDLTIRANFTQTLNNYTVTWKDEDGTTILKTDASVAYGATPSFGSGNPTKAADVEAAGYTYTFNAWNPAIATVTGDATYTASYTPHKKQYSLVWDVNGGNALTGEYTHGDNIEWGTPITAPADPTKDGFDFAGWDVTPAATMPAATTTYTAQWTAQVSTGTIRFLNWNNEVLQSGSVAYGTTPEYTGDAPTKASDLIYSYTFSGWDKAITPVDGDKDYKAVYTSADLATFTLEEDKNENDPYYGVLTQLVGKKRTVTYNRSMGADKWHVVSLPFEFNLVTHPGHPFSGNIYEMTGATYNDGYLDFNFMPMTTTMKANKPYIFYSGTPAENVVFEDVTFVDLARYTGEGSNVLISAGSVDFINTTYRKALNKENTPDKHKVYIYQNKLYYPNNNVIWMRAFRGYFYLNMPDGAIQHIRPRVLIVSGAGTATAIEASSEKETVSVKKYVENGILVIERNGVKYDAQGAKIE